MFASFCKVQIEAITGVIGKNRIDIKEQGLTRGLSEKKLDRIVFTTGFEKASVIPNEVTLGDMAVLGFKNLLATNSIDPSSIDVLYLVTQTPDYIIPSTSYSIQKELGLKKETMLLDIAQGCPAAIISMFNAAIMIESGLAQRALIVCGDISDHQIPKTSEQAESYLINGDACGLILLSRKATDAQKADKNDTNIPDLFFEVNTHGELFKTVIDYSTGTKAFRRTDINNRDKGFCVDGTFMSVFVLDILKNELLDFVKKAQFTLADLGLCIAQQSNKTMMQALAATLDVKQDKFPFLAKNTGNLSSASIPVCLANHGDQMQQIREKFTLLCADGVGLASSFCIANLSTTNFINTLEI